MSFLTKIFNKLGYIRADSVNSEKANLTKQLQSTEELYKKSKEEIKKSNQVIRQLEEQLKLEKDKDNVYLQDLINLEEKYKVSQEKEKEVKRKNKRLLNKQKEFKETVKDLETKYIKVTNELNVLKKQLEELGISDPTDITKLQDDNTKLRKSVSLMARYQSVLGEIIDRYRYGYSFAYIESLHPRTLLEFPLKVSTTKDKE